VIGHGSLGGNLWFGVSTDGAMADSFCVPEDMCFQVPPEVSLMQAALVELERFALVEGTEAAAGMPRYWTAK